MQQAGQGKFYARCQWGAYRMFFDSHFPVDFVHFDDIAKYKMLYFAYPIQMNKEQADTLKKWVEDGGALICEGLPGYFGDRGKVCAHQPGSGLDSLFGVRQKTVEFMPDLGDRIRFSAFGIADIPGGLFRQSYDVVNAHSMGRYPDGEHAAVLARHGAGAAALIGTFPSEGYYRRPSQLARDMLRNLLYEVGFSAAMYVYGEDTIQARLCVNGDKRYIWLINHDANYCNALISLRNARGIGKVYWGDPGAVIIDGREINVKVPGKDAVVFELI
jgi:beta-galactosidase